MKRSLRIRPRGFLNALEGLECRKLAETWAANLGPSFLSTISQELATERPGRCCAEVETILADLCRGKRPSAGYEKPCLIWELTETVHP